MRTGPNTTTPPHKTMMMTMASLRWKTNERPELDSVQSTKKSSVMIWVRRMRRSTPCMRGSTKFTWISSRGSCLRPDSTSIILTLIMTPRISMHSWWGRLRIWTGSCHRYSRRYRIRSSLRYKGSRKPWISRGQMKTSEDRESRSSRTRSLQRLKKLLL